MITEIDFKVKGEERKKLAYAIGELLGMPVKYTRTPKFDYLIGSCILDKNGVFYASGDLSESKLDLILERFYKGEPIQQSELPEDEAVKADVLSQKAYEDELVERMLGPDPKEMKQCVEEFFKLDEFGIRAVMDLIKNEYKRCVEQDSLQDTYSHYKLIDE